MKSYERFKILTGGKYLCSTCEEPRAPEEFYERSGGRRRLQCKLCCRERELLLLAAHPQRAANNARRWVQQNPEKRKEVSNRYYARHREEFKAKAISSSPARKAYYRQWAEKNKVKQTEYKREWAYQNSTLIAKAQMAARKKRKELVGRVFDVSERDWQRLRARYRGLCAYCEQRPSTDMDHVFPIIRGGSHSIGNLLPACHSCNSSKGHKLLFEWLIWKRRLHAEVRPRECHLG